MKAGKIKDAIVFRGVKGNPIVTSWYPIFLSYGGKFFDNNWKVTFNSAQGKAAAEFFVGKLKSLAPKGVAEYDSDQEGAAILGGKAGAIIQYTGNAIKSDDPKQSKEVGKLDFAVVPKQVKAIAQIGIFIHGVSASAPNKDNAITFMKWFAHRQGADGARKRRRRAGAHQAAQGPGADQGAPAAPDRARADQRGRRGTAAHARLGRGREPSSAPSSTRRSSRARAAATRSTARRAGHGIPQATGLLQLMAAQRTARARLQGAGFDRFLPYLLLAPAVLLVLAVVVYPLDLRACRRARSSTASAGDLERRLRPVPSGAGTIRSSRARSGRRSSSSTAAVAIETTLGLGLALLCVRELPFIRDDARWC